MALTPAAQLHGGGTDPAAQQPHQSRVSGTNKALVPPTLFLHSSCYSRALRPRLLDVELLKRTVGGVGLYTVWRGSLSKSKLQRWDHEWLAADSQLAFPQLSIWFDKLIGGRCGVH